jgi:hypothetical protein
MFSMPPATAVSTSPATIYGAAVAIAWAFGLKSNQKISSEEILEIVKSAVLLTDKAKQQTMNIHLQSAGYTEEHRETVLSRYGSAEIFEIHSRSGRFIGFQVYRNGLPEYAPFKTLKGAQVCANRPRSRAALPPRTVAVKA